MGLLDQLWDDTVAGPRPSKGLGMLRKHSAFSFRSGSGKESGGNARSYGGDSSDEAIRVTHSIMIINKTGYKNGLPPVSPAGSTPPASPFSGGRDHSFRFRRRSTSDVHEKASEARIGSPPSPYDV